MVRPARIPPSTPSPASSPNLSEAAFTRGSVILSRASSTLEPTQKTVRKRERRTAARMRYPRRGWVVRASTLPVGEGRGESLWLLFAMRLARLYRQEVRRKGVFSP
jgi:hypothetical protein